MDPVAEPISARKMYRVEPLFCLARRIELFSYGFPVVYALFVLAFYIMFKVGSVPDWMRFVVKYGFLSVVIMVFLQLVAIGVRAPAHRRLRRRLIESRCQLCPRCGYNLRGRARDEVACPECAYEITRRECVRRWCGLLRLW